MTVPVLAALAVIHIVDPPSTLGPNPLVGIGHFGIIVAAVLAGGAMIARSHRCYRSGPAHRCARCLDGSRESTVGAV